MTPTTVSEVLDALAPALEHETEAWADVLARAEALAAPKRAPRRRPARRRRRAALVLAFAALSLVAVVATAYALGHPLIDFSSAPPAPQPVVEDFASLSKGAPPGMDPGVTAGETRFVGELGGHKLWVAPTKSGGLCFEFSEAVGGCDALGTVPLGVTWGGGQAGPTIAGHVNARWADGLEVELDDGTTVRPDVVWISPPIDAGFFFYRAPEGRTIAAVRALEGDDVVAEDGPAAPSGPHPFADLSQRERVGEIETDDGAATLWIAPTRTEGRCVWLEFQGKEDQVVPCLPKGYEHQTGLAYSVRALGGHTILVGECGYPAVQLVDADAAIRTVECTDGLVFTDLTPAEAAGELRAVGADGQPLPSSAALVPPPDGGSSATVETTVLTRTGALAGPVPLRGERPYADLTRRVLVARRQTPSGTATLWTAPTKTGGSCTWLEVAGEEIPVLRCTPKGQSTSTRLAYAVFTLHGRRVLAGKCAFAALRIEPRAGRPRRAPCTDGLVFAYLKPHDTPGTVRPAGGGGARVPLP